MPKIGVSKPYVALYSAENGIVTYVSGQILAKAAELATTMNSSSDNNFYADNAISETDKEFSNGTGTLTVDDLMQEAGKLILGLTQTEYTNGDSKVTINHYDDDMESPYLGLGIIIKLRRNKVDKYRGVIYKKVSFNIPSEAVTTQGATISWQTSALPFTIERDDSEKHEWMIDGVFDTEDDAFEWIKSVLTPAV